MSSVLETRVDGSPDAIENVGIFVSNTVAAHAQVWSTDIASARARMLDGWTGAAADAFGSTTLTAKRSVDAYGEEVAGLAGAVKKLGFVLAEVQATMSDARRTAAGAGLTVSGTQIHDAGLEPALPLDSPGAGRSTGPMPSDARAYRTKAAVWNHLADTVGDAHDRWQEALRAFASVWDAAAGNLVSVATSLVTAGVSATALSNTAYRLKSEIRLDQQRLATAKRNLADSIKDGRALVPKDDIYALMDEAAKVNTSIAEKDGALRTGLRVGSKLSRGLLVLGIAGTAYGVYDDIQHGESATQAVASNAGGLASSLIFGGATGSIVGSLILPPAGTIAGAALGAVVGTAVGIFTSGVIDHLFEDASAGFLDTMQAGGDELADTGKAIGKLTTGAWHAIFG